MPAVLVPIESGKPIVLDKPIVLVGRHPDCDAVILNSRKISRKHCAVALVNNNFVVRDLGSMNGIWVNGERVEHQSSVRFGDELMIGDVRFILEADKPATGKPKPAAGKAREQVVPPKPVADAKPARKKPMISPPQSELSMEFPVPIDEDDDDFDVPPPAKKAAGISTDGDDVNRVKSGKPKLAPNKTPSPIVPAKPAVEVKHDRQDVVVAPPQSELSMEFAVPIDDDDVAAPAPAPVPVIPTKPAVVDVAPVIAEVKLVVVDVIPAPPPAVVSLPLSEQSMESPVPVDDQDDVAAVPSPAENVASANRDGEDASLLNADESGTTGQSMPVPEEDRSAVPTATESAHEPFEREVFIAEDDSFTVPHPTEKSAEANVVSADISPLRAVAQEIDQPQPVFVEAPAPVFPVKLVVADAAMPAPPKPAVTPPPPALIVEVPKPIEDKKVATPVKPPPPKKDIGSYTFVEGDDFIADSGSFVVPPPAVKAAEVTPAATPKEENTPVVPPPPKRDVGSYTFVEGDEFIPG